MQFLSALDMIDKKTVTIDHDKATAINALCKEIKSEVRGN